jgi:hypothetical protein
VFSRACALSLVRLFAWKVRGYVAPTADPLIRQDAFDCLYGVEVTTGVLAACLPMLRPLLHRKEYSLSARTSGADGSSRSNNQRGGLSERQESYAMGSPRRERWDSSTGLTRSRDETKSQPENYFPWRDGEDLERAGAR